MIGVEDLIIKINTLIGSGTLTDDQMIQLSGAANALENYGVSKVTSAINLPNPVTNKGRFFFIESENRYVFSNGIEWNISNILDTSGIRLYSWGNNAFGQLGDATTVSKLSPVFVIGGFTDWVNITGGDTHSLGLRANGTLWAWGGNTSGQLGDNTVVSKTSPVLVVGGFTDWVDISSGDSHVLGLRADGTAWAWGGGTVGRLGNNLTTNQSSPVSVVGGFTDWIRLSAGATFNIGIRANGSAWSWGYNTSGQLGDLTVASKLSPVSVVGGIVNWVQLSVGENHSLGLRSDGTAWSWGNNISGQLGDNSILAKSSPIIVSGGFTDWIQLNAGLGLSLGLRANGTAWAWGSNAGGKLGDNAITNRSSPVSVVGGFTDWIQVSVGDDHSVGLRANGTAWAWGNAAQGRLGDGELINRSSPVSVIGGITDWIQVSAGRDHSFGLRG